MAAWAADCAERVLPLFEVAYPGDEQSKEKRNGAHGNRGRYLTAYGEDDEVDAAGDGRQ